MTLLLATESWDAAARPATGRFLQVGGVRARRRRRAIAIAVLIAGAMLGLAAVVYFVGFGAEHPVGRGRPAGPVQRVTLPAQRAQSAIIYDTAVMPLPPEEASAINAKRPTDVVNPVPARALAIAKESTAGAGYAAALRCLTQAVYYEAASEPEAGQRGVAQVVLNRVRHPAFPHTVCGVVYQGAERVTGCQFSFTCDGSLARIPSVAGWARAERVARDALNGKVAAAVGNATHYHANYVVPYWAPTLDKAATIGAHIFYLMRGALGSPSAFRTPYDVTREVSLASVLAPPATIVTKESGLLDPAGMPNALGPHFTAPAEDARSGELIPGTSAPKFDWSKASGLRADEAASELKARSGGVLKLDAGGGKASDGQEPAPPDQ